MIDKEDLIFNLYLLLTENPTNIECEDSSCDDEECRLHKALRDYIKYEYDYIKARDRKIYNIING